MSEQRTTEGADEEGLDPTDAFALLSNDTRMAAVRVLWEADEPLRFSEIADRAGVTDTGNFNYHLGELVGHFVQRVGERYTLTRPGRRAVTAVLTGDVTERPEFEPVRVDRPCPYCGANVVLSHRGSKLVVSCQSCPGTFLSDDTGPTDWTPPGDRISTLPLPPAGIEERDPEGVLRASLTRLTARSRQQAVGVCSDCGGRVDRSVTACPDHADDGICKACGSRFAGISTFRCRTCGATRTGFPVMLALGRPDFHDCLLDRGLDFARPSWQEVVSLLDADESVHGVDPVDYEVAWTLDDQRLSMRVDGAALERDDSGAVRISCEELADGDDTR